MKVFYTNEINSILYYAVSLTEIFKIKILHIISPYKSYWNSINNLIEKGNYSFKKIYLVQVIFEIIIISSFFKITIES